MESLRKSDDFSDLLLAFNAGGVRYLVIGGFAVAAYGRARYTKDLDLWVDPSNDNPERVYHALAVFGAALDGITADDFRDPDCVFQIGVEPIRVDIVSDISGVRFEDAWPRRQESVYGSVPVSVISLEDLITNKRASGRPSDMRDVSELEEENGP